jgi:hypothetical protein
LRASAREIAVRRYKHSLRLRIDDSSKRSIDFGGVARFEEEQFNAQTGSCFPQGLCRCTCGFGIGGIDQRRKALRLGHELVHETKPFGIAFRRQKN